MTRSPLSLLPSLRATLFTALRRAGALIGKNIDKPKKIMFKGSPINLLTWVDQAADEIIRKTVRSRFPDHDLMTEEADPTAHGSHFRWIADPLDGTTNFAHQYPQVCTSIGLEFKGEIILGGVYDPCRDELFWAEKGHGAWMIHRGHSRRLKVSRVKTLEQSLWLTGFPYDRRERIDLYLSYVRAMMQEIQGIRRAGAAALDLCWVAIGRVDGYWEWNLKPWDVAAGKLILEEAGGKVTDFEGKPYSIYGKQTLATNALLHRPVLKLMGPLAK